ncbi:MAG TPA: hypothetical protein VFE50_21365 [Cyclobacteriaceae bacterium]|nr:hypothetical protein [Cyclobacteriaceae bacterium]
MNPGTGHWLANRGKETVLIILPLFIPVFIVILFRDYFNTHLEVTPGWWLLLVLLIDVSHVYSTLFRFYWERSTFQKYKKVLLIIPAVAFVVGLSLHLYDSFLFWRILAYVALYHFIRQQYGFLRLYSRKQNQNRYEKLIDAAAIYAATLYPVLYWHMNLTGTLSWFVPNDFVRLDLVWLEVPSLMLYVAIMLVYIIKEWLVSWNSGFNTPKNAIVAGTFLSWYVGIVMFHGDLTFTLLNVVAHGIPYMGLVWLYGEKKGGTSFSPGLRGVLIFVAVVAAFAYFEEAIWDGMIWKDHEELFPFMVGFEALSNPVTISVVVALLVLPQVTHYVLDGFIWRFSKDSSARIEG